MEAKSQIYDIKGVRSFETFLEGIPEKDKPECLKIFINEAGIVRRQLPSENEERKLLSELNRVMQVPLSTAILSKTEELLSADRSKRFLINSHRIFEKPLELGLGILSSEKER